MILACMILPASLLTLVSESLRQALLIKKARMMRGAMNMGDEELR